MLEFMKTIINALKMYTDEKMFNLNQYVNEKFVDSKADWNQNDETASNYIKNRPFSEKIINEHICFDSYVEMSQTITAPIDNIIPIGTNFTVYFNDNIIGSSILYASGYLTITPDLTIYIDNNAHTISVNNILYGSGNFKIVVETFSAINTIDKKYLPNIVGKFDGDHGEIFNDYETNIASGYCSHAEGNNTDATGDCSHAEGRITDATGDCSHAEGYGVTASGKNSHAEGSNTTASGKNSHAEGSNTTASGKNSHAEGEYTTASGEFQHVQGVFNINDVDAEGNALNTYAHIVGNGVDLDRSSNAHTLDWNGNAWFSGDVYTGSTSGTNRDEGSKKLASEEYVNTKANQTDLDALKDLVGTTSVQSQITSAIADLVDTAPDTLNTLGELATAIQENDSVIDTLDAAITNKADKTEVEALKTQVTATSLILADAITGQKYEIQIQNGQLVSFPVEE